MDVLPPLEAGARLVRFGYQMAIGARKIARGETTHMFLNRDMKPVRLPVKYWPLFGLS